MASQWQNAIARTLRSVLSLDAQTVSVVELRFPSELSSDEVKAVLVAASGLPARSSLAFETYADAEGIRHFLRGQQATLETVRVQLRALIPGLRVESAASPALSGAWSLGARLSWPGRHTLLRGEGAGEAAAGLLATLDSLAPGEAIVVQVALRPGRPRAVRDSNGSRGRASGPTLGDLVTGTAVSSELAGVLRRKYTEPLLQARLLVAISTGHRERSRHLLARILAVYRTRRAALGTLRVRLLPPAAIRRSLSRPPRRGDLLSARELVALIGWPINAPKLPGLRLGSAPLLFPDRRIPTAGRVIATATWPGLETRTVAQPITGALSHTLICGPTGSGKSALIANLVLADLREGRGLLVLDGKGDLADDLLARIPADRVGDVIVLDPAAGGPVPGLRVFGRTSDPELAADLVLAVLRDLFRDHWGVRSEQWLRAGLVTVAHDPQGTLGDLPFLFSDDAYRRRLVGKLADPLLQASWASFEAMHPREQANQLGAPLNKLGELLGRRVLRTVLSQPAPTLDLPDVLRAGKVVVVSAAPGQMGAPAARLLGALVVYQLLTAIQARSAVNPARRAPFMAYIDEPKVLGDIPVPLDSIFELARGLGVGLTLAAQSVMQLPASVRNAALTNAATLIAFRQNHDEDAALLARHLSGISGEALLNLGPFELAARIGLRPGETAATVSGRSLQLPKATTDPTRVRQASAARYGRDPSQVDRALHERHRTLDGGDDPASVGRRRRTP
jgi:hypothetical protein